MGRIIACIDGAGYTAAVCDYAAWVAMRLNAPLELLHVLVRDADARLDASGSIGLGAQEALLEELAALDARRSALAREHGRQILEGGRRRVMSMGMHDVATRQRSGELVEALAEIEPETRLFVLGRHDDGGRPRRFLLDHDLESAVRALQRPMLVAAAPFTPPRRFLIAFDGSATGRGMVEKVAESPLLQGLDGVVAMVGGEASALRWAEERLAAADFRITAVALQGEPSDALLDQAARQGADLLVMGAYGHSRIRHLVVGSTTTSILRQSGIPVFILR